MLDWRVHNHSYINLIRGLVERVFLVQSRVWQGLVPTPRPASGAFERLAPFRAKLRRWLPQSRPVDRETYPEYYRGRLRTIYQAAVESLRSTPIRAADAVVKTFVKAEKLKITKSKPDPCPRVIQPRDPRYNVEVGRYLRPIEKLVYRALGKVWGGATVLKMNATDQASALWQMWESFHNPVAVGLDASRFDQHVSQDALKWEHDVYLSCFRGEERSELARLLQWQLVNRGRAYLADARVKYSVDGCRMSGDINTSLGNCLLMCALVHTYCEDRGVRARLANNGDDCVVIMEEADLDRFRNGLEEWFLEFGFEMEVENPVREFEQIEFCQTHPVWTPDGYIMVRKLDVAISKDMVSLLPLDQCYRAYLGAVGQCGLSTYGGIPVYQEFYNSMVRTGAPSKVGQHSAIMGGLRFLSAGMSRVYTPVHPLTRVSFWKAFGMLPDEQELMEQWLRDNPLPPQIPQTLTPFAPVWYK